MIARALAPCEWCGFITCPHPDDCTIIMRVLREEDARRAELGLPPFAESTEEGDAAILRDPYAITCRVCGAEPTHADGYAFCDEHAPAGVEAAVL